MKNIFKRVAKDQFEQALEACGEANKKGYSDAKIYLKGLKRSIDDASGIIDECISNMKKHHINDESLVQSIKKQLQTVQTEFEESYFDTKENLEQKSRMSAKFNITLFGRTKAGKSTLMEILTHGDGSHMGDGGQRTTRDVRSYDWKGMSITDVPGIDAYGGEEDDKKAEEAAVYADLILFMITAGQPEGTEADWMVKLKKMDKPIVCICNYKQSLGESAEDFRLKRILDNPQRLEERMNIGGLVKQFNIFLKEQLPNEHVDFIVSHLLAKYYSQQKEYSSKKTDLEKVSRFNTVEQSIVNEVFSNGVLHRKKCYLSIIDSPLYQQMNQLYAFSASAYSQFRVIQDKSSLFEDWCDNFNSSQRSILKSVITREYNTLRNSISGFVEDHWEDDDVGGAWKKHCANFNIEGNIKKAILLTQKRLEEKIADLFSELESEMKYTFEWQTKNNLGSYKFIDWKRGLKWVGALSSAGLGIAALLLSSGPLGWAALGVGAVFSFFSWLFDSREDKKRERHIKLTKKLEDSLTNAEKKSSKKILDWYDENIITYENKVLSRLRLVKNSLLSLSNGERQLALGYSKNHKDINKMIIANIFDSMKIPMYEYDRIRQIARVPGRRIAIVINGIENIPCKISDLAKKLGNKEVINVIKWHPEKDTQTQVRFLLRYFGINALPLIKSVNNGTQTVAYLYNQNYNQEQLDSIDLVQQIMNVHIILK